MKRILLHRKAIPMAAVVAVMATLFVAPTRAWRPAPTDFIWISAGDNHTCASRLDGTTWCWGRNDKGQLGHGVVSTTPCPSGIPCISKPQQVMNHAFGQVDAGGDTTCALASGGAAFCWGDNGFGQVGTNFMGLTTFSVPQLVVGRSFTRISSGSTTSCGIVPDVGTNSLFCWGLLITGNTSTFTPTHVGSSSSALWDVSVSNGHVCTAAANALGNDIDCAGMDNFGQLGVNPTGVPMSPLGVGPFAPLSSPFLFSSLGNNAARVSTAGSAAGIANGAAYTCADQMSGFVQCVGDNEFGQLGLGFRSFGVSFTNPLTGATGVTFLPQTVGNNQSLAGVTTGMSHACALDPSTSLALCWGQGTNGELGNGVLGSTAINGPQTVIDGHTFRSLAAGLSHTCGIGTDNHIYCWGDNRSGQLGVSTMLPRTSHPQQVF
jgi:alpha-tubulin suppressor-like RCC1 family protein